jgi:hypothetical protein
MQNKYFQVRLENKEVPLPKLQEYLTMSQVSAKSITDLLDQKVITNA